MSVLETAFRTESSGNDPRCSPFRSRIKNSEPALSTVRLGSRLVLRCGLILRSWPILWSRRALRVTRLSRSIALSVVRSVLIRWRSGGRIGLTGLSALSSVGVHARANTCVDVGPTLRDRPDGCTRRRLDGSASSELSVVGRACGGSDRGIRLVLHSTLDTGANPLRIAAELIDGPGCTGGRKLTLGACLPGKTSRSVCRVAGGRLRQNTRLIRRAEAGTVVILKMTLSVSISLPAATNRRSGWKRARCPGLRST